VDVVHPLSAELRKSEKEHDIMTSNLQSADNTLQSAETKVKIFAAF